MVLVHVTVYNRSLQIHTLRCIKTWEVWPKYYKVSTTILLKASYLLDEVKIVYAPHFKS